MDTEGLKQLAVILGIMWVFLNFAIRIRSDIDQLRNRIVYNLDKDQKIEDQELRLYMLKKDINERALTLIGLIFGFAALMLYLAYVTKDCPEGIHFFLCANALPFLVLGCLGVLGGCGVSWLWKGDYEKWRKHIAGSSRKSDSG